jgi:hypothetical protein
MGSTRGAPGREIRREKEDARAADTAANVRDRWR